MEQAGFLGELLIEQGLLTKEQLSEAREEQTRTGRLLGHILVDFGFVEENDILLTLGKQLGMEVVDLSTVDIPQEILKKVSSSTAKLYGVIPIRIKGNVLTVAMADPLNPNILDDLRFTLSCDVRGAISNPEEMEAAILKFYGEEDESIEDLLSEMDDELSSEISEIDSDGITDIASLQELANDAPVIKLLNLILIQAIKDRASDVHFEPFEKEFKVRYRIDGALYEMVPPPKHLALAISSRIKVMADLDIAERRLPQDGRIQLNVSGRNVDLRISTLPTQFGESVVMRVLDRTVVALDLEKLGLYKDDMDKIEELIEKPNGIIILTGPTGSGKTTTLYSALKRINKIEDKIITTEDPIEYDLEGIMQVAIKPSIGLTFARCLRSILRQDPDKVMVGEVRDLETAQIAIQASLTGHLVFTTLHTNDAPGCITRLVDMGIEPFLITSTVQASIAQRLIRKICEDCKEKLEVTQEMLARINLTHKDIEGRPIYHGKGCSKCNQTGYRGRMGIFEMFLMNDALRSLVLDVAPTSVLRQKAKESGMFTLREDAVRKLLDGATTIEEVARET
ncbi:MAG: type II secretion system ATPase GspE [Candidatus Theseobacter exili]|nr:type II secretion system ATPase GspE [Candidatus Theseobacter exili]